MVQVNQRRTTRVIREREKEEMKLDFNEEEWNFIQDNKGTQSPAKYIRDVLRKEMQSTKPQCNQQGADNDNTKPKNK